MSQHKIKRINRVEITFGYDGLPVRDLLEALDGVPPASLASARLKLVTHYPGDQREPSYTEMRIDWEA